MLFGLSRGFMLIFTAMLSCYVVAAHDGACPEERFPETDCQDHDGEFRCGKNYSMEIFSLDNVRKYHFVELIQNPECDHYALSQNFQVIEEDSTSSVRWEFNVTSPTLKNTSTFLLVSTNPFQEAKDLPRVPEATTYIMSYVSHFITFDFFRLESKNTDLNNELHILKTDKDNAHSINVFIDVSDDRKIDDYAKAGNMISKPSYKLACVNKNNGAWSEDECVTISFSELNITCKCTTRDGSLSLAVKTEFKTVKGSAASMPIYFSLTIVSTLFLLLTWILLIRFHKVYKDPNQRFFVQLNLSTSLLLRHIFLLTGFGISLFDPLERAACQFVAVLHVYFLVTTVLWVLVEGIIIYRKVCRSSLSLSLRKVVGISIAVWFLPLVLIFIVSVHEIINDRYIKSAESFDVISVRVNHLYDDPDFISSELLKYRKFDFCWTSSFVVSLALGIPVTISLIINTVILVWVGVVVWKIRTADKQNTPESMRQHENGIPNQTVATFRAVAILTAVLGLPWLLSLLINIIDGIEKNSSLAWSYVHFACVVLQGPVLFFVYCAQKKELRVKIRRKIDTNNVKYTIGSKGSGNHS